MTDAEARAPRRTAKYLRRQEEILRAAVGVLNEKGVRGMTRANVAERFGMVATAVAYYFSSKEELAAACFRRGIAGYERLAAQAAEAQTPAERLARFIRTVVEQRRRIAIREADEIALFDDIRALADESVMADYVRLFQATRALIDPKPEPGPDGGLDRTALNARAHLILQQLMWLPMWLPKYDPADYPRAGERMADLMVRGLAAAPRPWNPPRLLVETAVSDDDARETFLRAATQLITEQGYVGASVDRIAARLDLTKGAFYHHIEAKDDLIATCYERTVEVIRRTQQAAEGAGGDGRERLAGALSALVERQLKGDVPLLRPATTSLPADTRGRIVAAFDRRTVHFGSMIGDAVADGSLRPVDVQIAAQMVTAAVFGSTELANWLPAPLGEGAGEAYLRPLFDGLAPPARQE